MAQPFENGDDRRRQIIALLKDKGPIHGYTLARYFGVNDRTIRRDIAQLRQDAYIIRAWGLGGYTLRRTKS